MGEGQSKLHKGNQFQSRDSLISTKENLLSPKIEFYSKNVNELKTEISGLQKEDLSDLKYEAYYATLTNYIKEIEELESTVKKRKAKICREMISDLNFCLALLNEKRSKDDAIRDSNESSNEQRQNTERNDKNMNNEEGDDEVFTYDENKNNYDEKNFENASIVSLNSNASTVQSNASTMKSATSSSIANPNATKSNSNATKSNSNARKSDWDIIYKSSKKSSNVAKMKSDKSDKSSILSDTSSSTFRSNASSKSNAVRKSNTLKSKSSSSKQTSNKTKHIRFEEIVLEQMNEKIIRLQNDINATIDLQLDMNYKEFENAIQEYFTELELISNPNNLDWIKTQKDELCKILIKYNNKIRKYKTFRKNQTQVIDTKSMELINGIQDDLKILKQTIDERELTNDYDLFYEKTLDSLAGIKAKMSNLNLSTNIELKSIKKQILSEISLLHNKLDEKIVAFKKKLSFEEEEKRNLFDKIRQLSGLVDEFVGKQTDESFIFLDQNLRRLWAKLNGETDGKMIESIKHSLAKLNDKANKNDDSGNGKDQLDGANLSKIRLVESDSISPSKSIRDEDFDDVETQEVEHLHSEKQIVQQIKEYQNHWHQLYYNVKHSMITSEVFMLLHQVFEKMEEDLVELAENNANNEASDQQNVDAPQEFVDGNDNNSNNHRNTLSLNEVVNEEAYGFFVEKHGNQNHKDETTKETKRFVQTEDDFGEVTKHYEEEIKQSEEESTRFGEETQHFEAETEPIYSVVVKELKKPNELRYIDEEDGKEENLEGAVGFDTYNTHIMETVEEIAEESNKNDEVNVGRTCTLGDLQSIQKEVNNISKELFNDRIDPIELKTKLEQQRKEINNLNANNETLQKTKEKILKNMDDTYKLIGEHSVFLKDVTKRNSFKEMKSLHQSLKETQKQLETLREKIQKFNGIERNDEYRGIERELNVLYHTLKNFSAEDERTQQMIAEIKKLNEELPKVLIKNQSGYIHRHSSAVNELRIIIEEVQELKRSMDTLDKVYLKESLEKCLEKIDTINDKNNEKAQIAKIQIKQKIFQYLKSLNEAIEQQKQQEKTLESEAETAKSYQQQQILEQRRSKEYSAARASVDSDGVQLQKAKLIDNFAVPSRINSTIYAEEQTTILENKQLQSSTRAEYVVLPVSHPDNPYNQIEEVRRRLIDIKASMDCFKGNYKDAQYIELEDRICQCKDFLNSINDNGSKLITTSKAQYSDYIKKLLKYFEAYVSGSTNYTQDADSIDVQEELKTIEKKLKQLHEQVRIFIGKREEYLLLKEEILAEKVKLEYLTIDNQKKEQSQKKDELLTYLIKLLKKLRNKSQRYSEELCDVDDLREIAEIKIEFDKIAQEIDGFRGIKNDENHKRLNESLINLVIRLDKFPADDNVQLKETKRELTTLLNKYLNLLHDKTVLPNFERGSSKNEELLTTDI